MTSLSKSRFAVLVLATFTGFLSASEDSCSPSLLMPYFEDTQTEQVQPYPPLTYYELGHFAVAVDHFNKLALIPEEDINLLLKSLYRFRQTCITSSFSPSSALMPYWDLVQILESVVEFSELEFLAEVWAEKYAITIPSDEVLAHLHEVFQLSAVKKVETILLHMSAGPNATTAKKLMEALQELGIQIIFADGRSEMNLDDLIDEHLVDLVISDGSPLVSERHVERLFLIGKSSDSKWSMSLDKELAQFIAYLAEHEGGVNIYSMANIDGLEELIQPYPDFSFKQFADFNEASKYFSPKICKREDKTCVSSLNNQVSLVIGNTKQTAFINSFLRIAQDARNRRNKDAKVYVTSMSTWDGMTTVERRDLANTYIYDAKNLSKAGLGYSQSARVTALVRDIISIYENKSIGVDYSIIPYLGYSGRYYTNGDEVRREIDLMKFSELK